jgi:diacylglycerol kinase family enzyme
MATSDEHETSKEFQVRILSPDGTYETEVTLAEDELPTSPPLLLGIDKRSKETPGPDRTAEQRETYIILSTGSGNQAAASFFREVVYPILVSHNGPEGAGAMKVHETTSATSILEFTDDIIFPAANNGKALRIILFSGDGGIVDLVNGLSSQPTSSAYIAPQVVLLPLGTANALYHSINTGRQNKWGLHALGSTTSKPLPTFTATFSPDSRLLVNEGQDEEELPKNASPGDLTLHGAVVASWGMHASLVADSDTTEYRKFGVERFKMAAKDLLYPSDGSPPHAYRGHIATYNSESNTWTELPENEHVYVLATLVSNLEATFTISPESKPLDGSMHLVHFGPRSGDEVMRIMGLAYQGGLHVKEEDVWYESIDGFRVLFGEENVWYDGIDGFRMLFDEEEGRWRRVCIDGKIVRIGKRGWMEVRKSKGKGVLDVVVLE